MKFVLGLLAGAICTLVIATLAGLDWEPPSRLDRNLLAQAPMDEVTQPESANNERASKGSLVANKARSTAATEPSSKDPVPFRSVTIEPLSAAPLPASPRPAPAPSLKPALADTATVGKAPRAVVSAPAAERKAPAAERKAPAAEVGAPAAERETTTAVVWKPFHSEVSATGFARRLSTQLGYPFRALREGPAKYHVVFDYDSEQQRELLREQVQALTGFSVI